MNPSLLGLDGKTVAIIGVANRRSVAFAIHKLLAAAGARVVHIVRDAAVAATVRPLLDDAPLYTCDVEKEEEITALAADLARDGHRLDGFVHSIAFANYRDGLKPFHETGRADFLQAMAISCYSLIALARELKPLFNPDAAIVTMSISTTRMAAESYGYMGPVKAALDSSVVFLAKSLSADSRIRVNAVGAGLLKTSASAGIPGYIDAYLFAEKAIPRKQPLRTEEAAAAALFLLSPLASGINAQTVVVDAGMGINYFDREIVRKVAAP
ncbi:MAG: SDR family oxidoreductase [Lentisphaeria bacterium]|jgi:enoyl-[acyl-carrier protein] reductase I